MRLCFAGLAAYRYLYDRYKPDYVLESFFYIHREQIAWIKECKMFLLDSGAFTFMQNSKKAVDWDDYLSQYINFINQNDVKYFFELDIDAVVGYEKVKELRARLERETGKKCIPVWHKSRGIEEYIKMCQEYDYIAIGGIVSKEIKPNEYNYLPKLIRIAEKYKTKVHGLGFTNKNAAKYGFYSVDSTSWVSSARFGKVDYFTGQNMKAVIKPPNTKRKHYKEVLDFVFKEWMKYQKYLDGEGHRQK